MIRFTASCFLLLLLSEVADCFPKELKPHLVVSLKETSKLPVFKGHGSNGKEEEPLDVQDIKMIDGKILIGSRNAFFVVSQSSFGQATGSISYDQMQMWKPSNPSLCQQKVASVERCQNYIRVLDRLAHNKLFICGTNAREPSCRSYQWSGSRFSGAYENATLGERFISSYDDVAPIAYKLSEGYMFSATRVIVRNSHTIARIAVVETGGNTPPSPTTVVQSNSPLPNLRTMRDSDWLNDPYFIKVVDAGTKMFIFFREEAVERSNVDEKVVYSRVAQVCKEDLGGSNQILGDIWSSFFKARLNCSIPGNRPFYFNELQHVTDVIMLGGQPTVFATFTTPPNSVSGSAVCGFTLNSIESAMEGSFLKQNPQRSCCWSVVNPPNSSSPSSCEARKDDETLRFIRSHRFMKEGVQPVSPSPIFTSTETRTEFSAIAVEPNSPINNTVVLYIGTNDGRLLKVLTKHSNQYNDSSASKRMTIFSEEWQVFRPGECAMNSANFSSFESGVDGMEKNGLKRVRNIIVLPDYILITFKHCVISVPKKACWRYKCKSACAPSGNPYCGWYDGYCARVTSLNKEEIEQDLFQEKTYDRRCTVDDVENSDQTCTTTIGIVFPLVVSLVVVFFLLLLGFICYVQGKKRNSGSMSINKKEKANEGGRNAPSCGHRTKPHRALLVRHTKDNPLRVTIEPTSPTEPLVMGERPTIGSPQPLNNLNMNSNNQIEHDETNSDERLVANLIDIGTPQDGSSGKHCQIRQIKGYRFSKSNEKSRFAWSPGASSASTDYGSTLPVACGEDTKDLERSRVLANPNYLPVTPCVSRNSSALKQNTATNQSDHSLKLVGLTTFAPELGQPKNERRKLVPDDSNKFDLGFPRPPSYVLNDSKTYDFSKSKHTEGSIYPENNLYSPNVAPKTTSNSSSSSKLSSFLSPEDILVAPYAGSTSSGFASSSPLDQFKDPLTSSRRGFIVAKGILSAQSSLASPNSRKNKRKKKTKPKDLKMGIGMDAVDDSATPLDKNTSSSQTSSNSSMDFKDETKKVFFPHPEFLRSSDEEETTHHQTKSVLADGLTPYEAKKSLRLFRLGKHKKDKPPEESFKSPAFDEEPQLPVVEGWQAIEYNPRYSTLFSKKGSIYYDDFCINPSSSSNASQPLNFYTMRPKGRMRQKMPKLRNTGKEWSRNNNPLPVPTPEIPDVL